MKEIYETPVSEIIVFDSTDIIATSGDPSAPFPGEEDPIDNL